MHLVTERGGSHYLFPSPPPLPLACLLPPPEVSGPAWLAACCMIQVYSTSYCYTATAHHIETDGGKAVRLVCFELFQMYTRYVLEHNTTAMSHFVSSMLRELSPPDPFSSGPSSCSSSSSSLSLSPSPG